MIYKDIIWNEDKYIDLIAELRSYSEDNYKAFNTKIIPTEYEFIGVRMPKLKEIAKQIATGDYNKFIAVNNAELFDTICLEGYIISYSKADLEHFILMIEHYILRIDNWASADILNFIYHAKKFPNEMYEYASQLIQRDNPWAIRVGVLILFEYVKIWDSAKAILALLEEIQIEHYYVRMVIAWIVSKIYTIHKNDTLGFMQDNKLDDWTHNKACQKIVESRIPSNANKNIIRSLKRK